MTVDGWFASFLRCCFGTLYGQSDNGKLKYRETPNIYSRTYRVLPSSRRVFSLPRSLPPPCLPPPCLRRLVSSRLAQNCESNCRTGVLVGGFVEDTDPDVNCYNGEKSGTGAVAVVGLSKSCTKSGVWQSGGDGGGSTSQASSRSWEVVGASGPRNKLTCSKEGCFPCTPTPVRLPSQTTATTSRDRFVPLVPEFSDSPSWLVYWHL